MTCRSQVARSCTVKSTCSGVPERACHLIATGALKAPRDRKGHRSRSERDFDVLRELTVAGVSEDAIRTIFASRAVGDKYRADGEHYLEHSLQNAANAFSAPRAPFVAVNDQWFVHSGRARKQVSTFVFEPRRLLLDHVGHEDDAFLGTVRAAGQSWDDVVLPKGAFASAQAFLRYLPSMYWQWLGQDAETRQLCLYLMAQLEEAGAPQARATTVVGRHGAHFVTKTATLGVERLYAYEEAPVVYINRGARRAAVDTTPGLYLDLPPEEPYRALVAAISADLPRSNTPAAVANFVGWFCACSIKPLLAAGGVRFPHLNVFGTKGAGKSASILRLYLPLLGLERPASWTPNTTNFVIRSLFSATNAVPVSFTEFRAATVESSHNDFLRTLLMAYDVGRDSRGRADLTTETFNLDAPVVVDGEDAIADPAMRERTIYVNLHPEDVEEEGACYAAFQRLTALPLRSFAGRFYQHTLRETPASVLARFERALEETHARLTVRLVDRMRRNVAVVLVGLELYNEFVRAWGGTELAWDARALAEVVDRQRFLLSDGRTRSLVDDFIEDVVAFVANETIGHLPFLHAYDVGSNVLWFHLLSALRWWHKDLRQRGMAGLEAPAMRAQLGERARAGYVLPETPIATTGGELPCFGIPLERAAAAGLSVPARLDARLCVVRSALI